MPRTTLYSIGSPTDEEQYYVELINRARANPAAEGQLLATTTDPTVAAQRTQFSVNMTMLESEFDALPVRPPLSINAALTNAARGHSNWMFDNAVQSHTGSGGSSPSGRATAAGYSWSAIGENIFSHADSVFHGHAGFEIDWGTGEGGMQGPPRGHRENIHSTTFREIGVGVKLGTNTANGNTVGPQLVTQDFGSTAGSTPFVTGVAYYDLNANGAYDPGEGIGGVTVNVSGASYHAVTASSGGYSVPVPSANASRTVSFSGLSFDQSSSVSIDSAQSVKKDLVATYSPPTISGQANSTVGVGASMTFGAIPGAAQYGWRYGRKETASAEGCDSLNQATAETTAGYTVVETAVKHSGTASWHLLHPSLTNATQSITLQGTYFPAASASLQFRSRLGWATATQVTRVQVSEDNGATWVDVNTLAGTGTAGQTSFVVRTVSLSAYQGKAIRVRFAYTVSGSRFTQTDAGVGWYIDTLTFTNLSLLSGVTTVDGIDTASFSFNAPAAGTYLLAARPYISGRYWAYGPVKEVTAAVGPPGFAGWAAPFEVAKGLPAGTLSNNPAADYNGDGYSNLMAYALNLSPVGHPTDNDADKLPKMEVVAGSFQLTYRRDLSKTDVVYESQAAGELGTWFVVGQGDAPAGFVDALISTSGDVETRRASVPMAGNEKLFLRLQVRRP